MKRQSLQTLLVVGVVLLAGCAGGISGSGVGSSDTPAQMDGTASATDSGTVSFYISDEKNAIGDFDHLDVTVTRVGFERADGGWVERDVDNATVDLTELQGANATLVDQYDVPNGTYQKVFVHVSGVNATLENGEQVDVKLPSEKLQIEKEFAVENGSEVNFVFDIAVHKAGDSGKYILKPVISESGTDVPIETDDEREDAEDERNEDDEEADEAANETDDSEDAEVDDLNAEFVGNVSQGENATVRVTRNGSAVENATVVVNDEVVGATDADGERTFTVPDADDLAVTVQVGDEEAELEREFEDDE